MSVRVWPAVGLALLFGFGLRVYQLGTQSIWADEIYSVIYSQKGWLEIIPFNVQMQDPQPPLYYLMLKAWVSLAGTSEFAYRFPSLAGGVGSVALIYALGRRLLSPAVGAVAAAVLAVNPYHVWYAQEARTYTLTAALALLTILLYVRILHRAAGRGAWIGLVVVSSLLVYSHYYGFLIVLFENVLYLLLARSRGLPLRPWLLAQTAFVVPYLPFAGHGVRMMIGFQSANPAELSWRFVERSLVHYSLGWFLDPAIVRWVFPSFLALAGLGLVALLRTQPRRASAKQASMKDHGLVVVESAGQPLRLVWAHASRSTHGQGGALAGSARGVDLQAEAPRRDRSSATRPFDRWEQLALLLGYVLIPVGAAVAAFQLTGRILLYDRYFILITPAYFLFIGLGIAHLGRIRPLLAVAALAFVGVSSLAALHSYYTDPRYARYDLRAAARYVVQEERAGDGVAVMGELVESVFRYYYRGSLPIYRIRTGRVQEVAGDLSTIAPTHRRLWLLPYAADDTDRAAEGWLDGHGYRVEALWFKTARLRLYDIPAGRPEVVESPAVPWEGGPLLTGLSLSRTTVDAGESIDGRFTFRGIPSQDDYSIVVRLLDRDGHALAHTDRALREGNWEEATPSLVSMGVAVAVPYGTPPGSLELSIGLRHTGGHSLAYLDENGSPKGTLLPVARITVRRPAVQRPLESIGVPRRVDVPAGPGLRLVGYAMPDAVLTAGQPLQTVLYWEGVAGPRDGLEVVGQIVDRTGRVVGEQRATTASRSYPPNLWSDGEIVRDYLDLPTGRVPATGEYQVRLKVGNDIRSSWLALGAVRIVSRERRFGEPAAGRPLVGRFADFAQLVGYDLSSVWEGDRGVLVRGRPLTATLYWRAGAAVDVNYTAFVHLLNAEGRLVAQHDGMPGNGAALTSTWLAGELVVDPHLVPVPDALPAGTYRLVAGLYDGSTGRRVLLAGGGDHLVLSELVLRP
ncbi:MAG: glycosyltransferase family 39 protein [Chloroflexi bacterium]|nr:glycosyltransferase family 39 protein [Chloroflexota bacterium]